MNILYRPAVPDDTLACIELRGRTRENAFSKDELAAIGVTAESWRAGIESGAVPGYIALSDGMLAGYCFGDRDTGEIVVLAILPEFEGAGLGKALLRLVMEDFRRNGFQKLFLGCSTDPAVRSFGFYRHLGWKPTGELDAAGDEILVYWLD
ncbi:GNAT family N-acetyltransferase [Pandoraea pulmonicola]|uniref:GNAT family N-acetyltransferase n=1 Tax=Pandoraea pulmonicola TaxID=93221 RepID=A0AAJ4ZGB7_PANPU|nr:GNAT family N-acetyltransferase [Pandoraea pulmonicola]AJC22881.1 GNAT family N-acetyltransferase [Pandoraea pulmonicola]SUA92799.1 Predicted acetyltransferase [Pandoraea pulmonicola]